MARWREAHMEKDKDGEEDDGRWDARDLERFEGSE